MRVKIIWSFVTMISLVPRTVSSRQYLLNEWMNVIGVGGRVHKTQISISENEYLWTRTGVFLCTKSCPEFFSHMQFIKLPRVLQKKDYSFQLPENSKGLQLLKRKSWQRWQHLIGKAWRWFVLWHNSTAVWNSLFSAVFLCCNQRSWVLESDRLNIKCPPHPVLDCVALKNSFTFSGPPFLVF